MTTRQINVERFSLASQKSFQQVLASVDAAVGHPNIETFWKSVNEAETRAEIEKVIHEALVSGGNKEFSRK